MRIWIDADACPGEVKELLYRTADRRRVRVTLVANSPLRTPRSDYIDTICVPGGLNVADRRIVELAEPGDLVITADIPLAAAVVEKGAQALDPRGELYTDSNIGERLAARNLLDQLRGGGLITGGPTNFSATDRQAFANQLDRWLAKLKRPRNQSKSGSMKILFLHGWQSVSGGVKSTYLVQRGHEVVNPPLSDDDWDDAIRTAQYAFDRQGPDVVVGSSRGGAIAMNLIAGRTPLVLLCPAWRRWGTARIVKLGTLILHSRADDVIPFADSEELVRSSRLPTESLIEVGGDHRLADPEPLAAMLRACEASRPITMRSASEL